MSHWLYVECWWILDESCLTVTSKVSTLYGRHAKNKKNDKMEENMPIGVQLLNTFAGTERRMRRMIGYWAATILLYVIGLVILWADVNYGQAMRSYALLFTVLVIPAQLCFFILIRNYQSLGLTPAQLSLYQARFAILCTGLAYTALGPLRGSTLAALFVILTFTTFSLEASKSRSLSILAIIILGLTMLAMPVTAPQFFDPKIELFHFTLAGSMLLVVGVLSGRLSDLRASLKSQHEELVAAVAQIRTQLEIAVTKTKEKHAMPDDDVRASSDA